MLMFAGPTVFRGSDLEVPTRIELNKLQPGETRGFNYVVRNDSSDHVEITSLRSSCACTNIKLEGETKLAPGAQRVVTGEVSLGRKIGSYEIPVYVVFRNSRGEEKVASTTLTGKVIAALVVNHVNFGSIEVGDAPQVVSVTAAQGNSGEGWDEIQAIHDERGLSVALKKLPTGGCAVTVTIDPAVLPISQFRRTVRLSLSNGGLALPFQPTFTVGAQIKGPIKATPASIYLGATIPNQSVERVLRLSSQSLDLRLLRVEKMASGLSAEMVGATKDSAEFKVSYVSPAEGGMFKASITFLHEPTGIRIEVPILGAARNDPPK
jgi:hypothetical protein